VVTAELMTNSLGALPRTDPRADCRHPSPPLPTRPPRRRLLTSASPACRFTSTAEILGQDSLADGWRSAERM